MKHKSDDYKISAVNYYLKNKDNIRKTCKIFDCSKSSLQRWIQKYKTSKNLTRKNRNPVSYTIDKNEQITMNELLFSMKQKYNSLCFEWVSEFLDIIFNSLNYLYKLGYRNFYIQLNNDEYTFAPNEYYTIEKTKEILNNTTPQNEWGMIWCK